MIHPYQQSWSNSCTLIALMEWLLKYYSKEGDVVLDPTMGSGSTGVACKNMNRNFIGIEKDPEIYEVAVNRID